MIKIKKLFYKKKKNQKKIKKNLFYNRNTKGIVICYDKSGILQRQNETEKCC